MGFITCILFILVVPTMGQNVFSDRIVLNNDYNVSWNFNASLDTFEFVVEVRATGWVGFGFALTAPNGMQNYDVAVGGVFDNGTGYLQDYYTIGQSTPTPEPQQDFILINATEQNGVTSLTFSRKRNTTDNQDVVIQQGMPIFLIWAYHSTGDVQPSSFPQHMMNERGWMQQILLPAITPSPTPATATPAVTATPVMEMRPMHFANFLSLDADGNYNMSWMLNSSMDTLHFMVEVRTIGWIGFGVATQASTNMVDYDVAVGGVRSGMGYLQDYLTVGLSQPRLDLQQDWMLSYSREENGVTTLRFYRQLDTNDAENDTAIQQGMPMFLIWAYHSTSDVQPSSFPQHTGNKRGWMQQILLPAITPSPTPATATPAVTATPVMEMRPMHFANFISFDADGNYNMSWMLNSSMDSLHFMVEVRTIGWIGFGVATQASTNMVDYDVAVGGVRSGMGYLQDYLTVGLSQPRLDLQQDWMLSYSREENGVTTLRFYRQLDTNDAENDTAIQQGMPMFLIWAYHSTSDVQPSSFPQHTSNKRGWMQQILLPAITPSPTPATATPAVTATPVMEMRPMHFANFLSLDPDGNYNMSWMLNSSMDTLHFMVEVRTIGWIGFGVATQAPTNMDDYDVAVGGVRSGMGYLQDYLTVGLSQPRLDLQQDWMLSYSREENGVTTLRFYRQLDTNDAENDTAIQQGMSMFLIWAYHSTSDVQPSSFPQHMSNKRGWMQQILLPAITPSPTPATATPAVTATPVMEMRPMHFANFLSLDADGNYNMSWMLNSSMDTLHFMVEVRTIGWIGFGVATQASTNMIDYDVAVGGVRSGMGYLQDYLTVGLSQPRLDLQQDWMLSYSREENGVTTLRFYRQLDTNDAENDTAIQQGMPMFLIWAYHSTSDVQPSSFPQHTSNKRGWMQQILLPAITPSPTPATATPAVTATPVMEMRPMHFANFISFDADGNYNMSWMLNSSMDTLHFMVEVRTIGWIGFGVATQAPTNMDDYDVAVGGVRSGMGYLQDYLTVGLSQPRLDLQQDWMLSYSREENGVTTLRFYRQLDTNDAENDIAIQQGMPMFLIWAYHSTSDVQPSSFPQHMSNKRGWMQQILLPAITPSPTPDPVPRTQPTRPGQGGGAGQGGAGLDEKAKRTRLNITILLAVSLGLIVVCLILISMGLAYFCRVFRTNAVSAN